MATTRLQALEGKPIRNRTRINYEELQRRASVELERQQREEAARQGIYGLLKRIFAGATSATLERQKRARELRRGGISDDD